MSFQEQKQEAIEKLKKLKLDYKAATGKEYGGGAPTRSNKKQKPKVQIVFGFDALKSLLLTFAELL